MKSHYFLVFSLLSLLSYYKSQKLTFVINSVWFVEEPPGGDNEHKTVLSLSNAVYSLVAAQNYSCLFKYSLQIQFRGICILRSNSTRPSHYTFVLFTAHLLDSGSYLQIKVLHFFKKTYENNNNNTNNKIQTSSQPCFLLVYMMCKCRKGLAAEWSFLTIKS